MKVTLDLDQLLEEGRITRAEYERLRTFAAKSTGSHAFNILVGFGVIAVSAGTLALMPTPGAAIVVGLIVLVGGLALLRSEFAEWALLANICILVGALMAGGGIMVKAEGSLTSILTVTALYAATSIIARSALLAVLATLTASASLGAGTAYSHAAYYVIIGKPILTVILFSALSFGLFQLSKGLRSDYERIAIASSRTGVLVVNLGFWVGSLWGDEVASGLQVSGAVFALLWAMVLVAVAIWAWHANRRWVLNTAAVFGGINFYTQWFEDLGASPGTVVVGGLLALGFAVALKVVNASMKANA